MADQQLRALHVVSGDLWAGAEAQVCALLAAMHGRGDVVVAAAILNPGVLAERLREAGIEVFAFDESQQSALQLWRGLRRVMARWRPDVVHTHRQKENILGALAAWSLGIPSVRTAHGAAEHAVPWWQLHRLHKRLLAALDDQLAVRLQRRVVAVADELAGQLRAALPGAQVALVNNGIDVAAVRALAAPGLAARPAAPPWRLAIVGRLVPVKRVDLFIAMADSLEQHHPGVYEFHVIGAGPLRARLEAAAGQGAAAGSIHFHGFCADVLPLMAGMHALLNTSDHEGLPMTALEALALDLHVIARAVGGLVPLLQGNSRARLIDSGDPAAFAMAVAEVLPATGRPPITDTATLPEAYTLRASVAAYVTLYAAVQA